jgi:hypothetical protein
VHGRYEQRIFPGILVVLFWAASLSGATAGTTGTIRGHVDDRATKAPLAGVTVTVTAPSGASTAKTDAHGDFLFISLSPDTYVLSARRSGYDPASVDGVTVSADSVAVANVEMSATLKTIARTSSRASGNLVRPGDTQDVYSVNPAQGAAASTIGGASSLNQAYGALAALPGVDYQQGQQGWGQMYLVRGSGDVSEEMDGIPISGSFFSVLGQQQLQLYAGGSPASADAAGTSGYINQVIKTGTIPGYATAEVSAGAPAFYHKAAFEAGGATPDRTFSYYVGVMGFGQDNRFVDQYDGASDIAGFWTPIVLPTGKNGTVFDGSGKAYFTSGITPQQVTVFDREGIVNLHFAIPHRNGQYRDDVQFLAMSGYLPAYNPTSVNDLGGAALLTKELGYYPIFPDDYTYNESLMAPATPSTMLSKYFMPNTPANRAWQAPLPPAYRDNSDNEVSLDKLQYQHAIDDRSFLRVYGYANYSYLGYTGADSGNLPYGPTPAEYITFTHTYGFTGRYENQLSSQHLVTATATVSRTGNSLLDNESMAGLISDNFVDAKGNCYNYVTGAYDSCYDSGASCNAGYGYGSGFPSSAGCSYNVITQYGTTPQRAPKGCSLNALGQCANEPPPPGSPAALHGAHWAITETGLTGNTNNVTETDYGYSIADQYRPNDRLVANVGLRLDQFDFSLPPTTTTAARNFWFAAFNREYCTAPGGAFTYKNPSLINPVTGAWPACPSGFSSPNLRNVVPGSVGYNELEPRLGMTYTFNPDTVMRLSYGRYASSPGTNLEVYAREQDLPDFLSQFLPFGFNTPYHPVSPQLANSFDLSLEKHVRGTDVAFRITPFYHEDFDEIEFVPIGYNGDTTGVNGGLVKAYGLEFALTKGDFSKDGLSFELSYTYTNSESRYDDITPGVNFIDTLNSFIQQYNSYTHSCTSGNRALCGAYGSTNARRSLPSNEAPKTTVLNPYYSASAQPLLDPNAWYPTYAELAAPFTGSTGQVTPNVFDLVLSYKHGDFHVTPTVVYGYGKTYGSPLSWPGYVPQDCLPLHGTSGTVNPKSCTPPPNTVAYLFTPDLYTGVFDSVTSFKEPGRLTLNLSAGYDISPAVTLSVTATGLVDRCFQHGYLWDDSNVCVFDTLAYSIAPVGNFASLASAPVQLRYPYNYQYNPLVNGFTGTKVPTNVFFTAQIKI